MAQQSCAERSAAYSRRAMLSITLSAATCLRQGMLRKATVEVHSYLQRGQQGPRHQVRW